MPEVRLPDEWNEWEIDEQVGRGSFGIVYKAERRLGNNSFFSAIKIIHIPLEEQDTEILRREYKDENSLRLYYKDLVESCLEEIHTMEQLKGNSNIVSIEDSYVEEVQGKIGWNIYILMEFLRNLARYIRENRLNESDVIRIGIDICNALEQCEKIKIVHRDIKVDNIFVSLLGCFKLGDFGIARKLEKSVDCYSSKGTFSYMAPEVFHGERYGAPADIYSLGLVMYKILNKGRDPFVDVAKQMIYYRDKEDALQKRMSGEILPLPVDASEKLGKIIIKACDYNPIHRYKNAEEFRKALETATKPENTSPGVKPDKKKKHPKDREKKKGNRTKAIVIPLVILVLVLGARGINKVVKKQDLNGFSVPDDTTWDGKIWVDTSAETIFEETRELMVNFKEYAGDDYKHFAELYRNTPEETIKEEFDGAQKMLEETEFCDRQIFQVVAKANGYYAVGNTFYVVYGALPKSYMEYSSYIWIFSEKNGEWKFDYSDAANEIIANKMAELYPERYVQATNEGRNTAFFADTNYMYLDESNVYEGCSNSELKYMYQNDDGSVVLGIWLANGSNNNIYYSSGTLTVTDDTLGTVIDLSDLNVDTSVEAMSSRVVELTVPASEIMTGTQSWGSLDSNFDGNWIVVQETENANATNGDDEMDLEKPLLSTQVMSGNVTLTLIDKSEENGTVSIRITNNTDRKVETFGEPILIISGESVELDSYLNMDSYQEQIAARTYKDITYFVDSRAFTEDSELRGELWTMDSEDLDELDRVYRLKIN